MARSSHAPLPGLQERCAALAALGRTADQIVAELATSDLDPVALRMLENQAAIAAQRATQQPAQPYRASRGFRSGQGGFTMVDNLVRDEIYGRIKPVDFTILMYFVFEFERYHRNPIKHLDITAALLAERVGVSKPTALEALDRLVDAHHLLEREERRDADGHRMATRYRLRLDASELGPR